MSTAFHARCLLAAALAASAGAACARNDRLLLPIDAVMRNNLTRQMLAPEIALRFGSASAVGVEPDAVAVDVRGQAEPFASNNVNNPGNYRQRRTDEQICQDAFRKALVDLQQRARSAGATAVVGIVGNYNRMLMDSREVYECHVGHTRGIVDLRARLTRGAQPVTAPPVARAPAPAPQPAAMQPPAAAAPQPGHIASGFAAIDDIDAIPYLSDRGRTAYREWLALPTPKAFAVSNTGFYFATSGLRPRDTTLPTDPNERALQGCERNAKVQCKLYAVNGSVVWTKDSR